MKYRVLIGATMAAGLVTGCSGGAANGNTSASNTATAASCTSDNPFSTYSGFSPADAVALNKARNSIVTASFANDRATWTAQTKQFADQFLAKIGLKPDSLCSNDYKAMQGLMSATTDFASRTTELPGGAMSKDELKAMVTVLYNEAGLTAARGADDIDAQVDQSVSEIIAQSNAWKPKK